MFVWNHYSVLRHLCFEEKVCIGLTWWVAPACQTVAAKYCCIQRKAVLHLHANQAVRLIPSTSMHPHTQSSLTLSSSLFLSPHIPCRYEHICPSKHSCIENFWKQALINFLSVCLCGRYQYVLSHLNMEVSWHWHYLMSAHSSMAANIDLPTLKVLGMCQAGFCFSVICTRWHP